MSSKFTTTHTEMVENLPLVRQVSATPIRTIIDIRNAELYLSLSLSLSGDIPTARAIRGIMGFMSVTKPENRRRVKSSGE